MPAVSGQRIEDDARAAHRRGRAVARATGRERNAVSAAVSCSSSRRTACAARARACATPASSSATAGTTILAASVGVEARWSATWSRIGRVGFVPDRADDRRRAGGHGTDEGFVGERQQVVQRAAAAGDDDDVDLVVGVQQPHGLDDAGGRLGALHQARTGSTKWTDGHRLRAFSSTSRSASEALPVTSPMPRGRKGSGRFEPRVEEAFGGERASPGLELGEQLAFALRPDLTDVERKAAVAPPRTTASPGRRRERPP